jgi:glucose/arabinose dehydrogenase
MVYLSYAESRSAGKNCTTVGRGKLSADDRRLENFEVIFRQEPEWASNLHFGSRLAWSRDGLLYITMGERSLVETRGFAQDLDKSLGKVLRVNPDGSGATGNPFSGNAVRSKIWSYGHRNVQAAAIHPDTGELWTAEHGPQGGDELNKPQAGKNYGWPTITYGEDYFTGAKLGEGTQKSGMEQPVYYWDPVIAPSGMFIYSGNMFPEWRGNIFVGSLTPGGVVRLMLRNDKVVGEQILLSGRTRNVEQAPDGSIWVMKDDGTITRIFK